jgi:biofilm protein TabA
MALYGKLEDCAAQTAGHPGFEVAFQFLEGVVRGTHEAAQTLAALPEGQNHRVDLDGDRVYALLQHARTRPRQDQQMEAHRDYADVQFALGDGEAMEVVPLEGLAVTRPYTAESDAELYAMPAEGSRLLMGNGTCAVLYPNDAHAPLQARDGIPQFSRRVVVKVRDPLRR